MVTFLTNEDTKLTKEQQTGLVEKKQIDILSFIGKIDGTKVRVNSSGEPYSTTDANYYTNDFIYVPKGEILYLVGKFFSFIVYDANKETAMDLVAEGEIPQNQVVDFSYIADADRYVQFSIYNSKTQNPVTITSSYYSNTDGGVRLNAEQIAQAKEELIGGMEYRNMLTGKKWVACGDSFTAGVGLEGTFEEGLYAGENKVYPYYIGRRCGMNVVNEAIAGTTMTYSENVRSFVGKYSTGCRYKSPEFDDADYITLKFGINDDSSHHNLPIGTIDDATNTTFYGAWNEVLEYLIVNHPTAHIGIIVTNGSKDDIVEATINVAKKWGVPYLDLATGEQVPLVFKSRKYSTDIVNDPVASAKFNAFKASDDSHPNAIAHEYESTFIEAWLMTI